MKFYKIRDKHACYKLESWILSIIFCRPQIYGRLGRSYIHSLYQLPTYTVAFQTATNSGTSNIATRSYIMYIMNWSSAIYACKFAYTKTSLMYSILTQTWNDLQIIDIKSGYLLPPSTAPVVYCLFAAVVLTGRLVVSTQHDSGLIQKLESWKLRLT